MKVNDPKIRDIFNGCRVLEIPFFQRSYVWDEDNWERFLEDMKSISADKDEYFLGSLMLKSANKGTSAKEHKILIDGQQRMTTLIIFLKVLSLKANNDE